MNMKTLFIISIMTALLGGCIHPQVKFRKAKLLDPTMDPAKTSGLYSTFRSEPYQQFEKGSVGSGGASGGSCPTCGS